MMTLLDYKKTLAYLAYLGYPRPTPTALKVNRPRKIDLRSGALQRSVFLGYVFGATGSGKVSFTLIGFTILYILVVTSTRAVEKNFLGFVCAHFETIPFSQFYRVEWFRQIPCGKIVNFICTAKYVSSRSSLLALISRR